MTIPKHTYPKHPTPKASERAVVILNADGTSDNAIMRDLFVDYAPGNSYEAVAWLTEWARLWRENKGRGW